MQVQIDREFLDRARLGRCPGRLSEPVSDQRRQRLDLLDAASDRDPGRARGRGDEDPGALKYGRAGREPADDGDRKRDNSLNVAGERFCLLVSLQQLSRFGRRGNALVAEQDLIDRPRDEIRDSADERVARLTGTRARFLARSHGAGEDSRSGPARRPSCIDRRQALNATDRSNISAIYRGSSGEMSYMLLSEPCNCASAPLTVRREAVRGSATHRACSDSGIRARASTLDLPPLRSGMPAPQTRESSKRFSRREARRRASAPP